MTDFFATHQSGLQSPASYLTNISPNDTTDLANVSRALNVASSGSVRVTTVEGSEATVYIVAGNAFPVRVSRVWATGTTATGIVVMY